VATSISVKWPFSWVRQITYSSGLLEVHLFLFQCLFVDIMIILDHVQLANIVYLTCVKQLRCDYCLFYCSSPATGGVNIHALFRGVYGDFFRKQFTSLKKKCCDQTGKRFRTSIVSSGIGQKTTRFISTQGNVLYTNAKVIKRMLQFEWCERLPVHRTGVLLVHFMMGSLYILKCRSAYSNQFFKAAFISARCLFVDLI